MSGRSRSYREGLLRRLKDNSEAANYLEAALDDSYASFRVALKNVLDARKVAAVARESNVSREHIYQMLTKTGNPTLNSLERILSVLGLRLAIRQETQTPRQDPVTKSIWMYLWDSGRGLKPKSITYRTTLTSGSTIFPKPATSLRGAPATDREVGSRSAPVRRSAYIEETENFCEIAC